MCIEGRTLGRETGSSLDNHNQGWSKQGKVGVSQYSINSEGMSNELADGEVDDAAGGRADNEAYDEADYEADDNKKDEADDECDEATGLGSSSLSCVV